MPIVDIAYDNSALPEKDARILSESVHNIVSNATGIKDVPVYASSADVRVKAAPIEIFIRMSRQKIKDRKQLVNEIRNGITAWKKKAKFEHKVNFTLIPMDWDIDIEE
jgi:2C-methyl-D-erythritol 2,4-cyclodiphosphate synthase